MATISIPRSISTSSRSASAICRAGRCWRRRRGSRPFAASSASRRKLAESGAFANPRSHIYYLPELYCAYFGRCYAAFIALPPAARAAIDPDGAFELIRARVLAYVQGELIACEMNAFDAALALIALGHLDADVATFAAPLHCIIVRRGEGGRHGPYRAYEWNKMKTPTRILVGGPEVTSAFVLMGLSLARREMAA